MEIEAPMRSLIITTLILALQAATPPIAAAQADIPALTGRVVDVAGLLSPAMTRTLVSMLEEHESATSNQVVVLTVPGLAGEDIESYALRVARAWGVGHGERDNGVLLVVAEAERAVRIEVGYGLEGDLPDVTASRIIRHEIISHFRAGSYDEGVAAGAMAIIQAIDGTYVAADSDSDELPVAARLVFGMIFLIIPAGFAFAALLQKGLLRWFLFVFLMPFFFADGFLVFLSAPGAVVWTLLYAVVFILLSRSPAIARLGEKARAAAVLYTASTSRTWVAGAGGSVSSGSFWSGGGSSWSSGGGSSFSGGGGSFGGGGASGGW
jgi:uncharacterized protein